MCCPLERRTVGYLGVSMSCGGNCITQHNIAQCQRAVLFNKLYLYPATAPDKHPPTGAHRDGPWYASIKDGRSVRSPGRPALR
ncbi:hypothetical protein FKM82_029984 [Ascaphus truei]